LHLQLKFSPLSEALPALASESKVKFCVQRSVNGYCQSLGYDRAILTEPQIGENAACDPNHCINKNWSCVDERPPAARIDMADACEFQYAQIDLTAWPLDPHDAFTWQCYTIP
jgi:hypothetical protein